MTWERHDDIFLWQPADFTLPPLFRIAYHQDLACLSIRTPCLTDILDYPDASRLATPTFADLDQALLDLANVPPDWPFPYASAPSLLEKVRSELAPSPTEDDA